MIIILKSGAVRIRGKGDMDAFWQIYEQIMAVGIKIAFSFKFGGKKRFTIKRGEVDNGTR